MFSADTRIVAFVPAMPGWGSWQWAGDDMRQELADQFSTVSFGRDAIPAADVVMFVKFPPSLELIESVSRRAAVIYLPVDYYGSAVDIDADAAIIT